MHNTSKKPTQKSQPTNKQETKKVKTEASLSSSNLFFHSSHALACSCTLFLLSLLSLPLFVISPKNQHGTVRASPAVFSR